MSAACRWSVVIPTHDTRELTCRCLESLENGARAEVIVVDDASRDGTREEVERRFPGVEVVTLERNVGFTVAANLGLERARGDHLLLLNSDTELPAGSWPALHQAFEDDPRLGVAGGRLIYGDGRRQWSGGKEPGLLWFLALSSGLGAIFGALRRAVAPADGERAKSGVRPVDWVSGAAMAFRRSVWEGVGPFDSDFVFYCQDLDFCLRARDAGWRVAVVKGFHVVHHHGATVSKGGGTVANQNPELLWGDLVRWAGRRQGPRWARLAAVTLRFGGRLRLAGRRLARALGGGRRDPSAADADRAYRRALESVRAAAARL